MNAACSRCLRRGGNPDAAGLCWACRFVDGQDALKAKAAEADALRRRVERLKAALRRMLMHPGVTHMPTAAEEQDIANARRALAATGPETDGGGE